MAISAKQKKIIRRCQNSTQFFVENFCRIQHPTLGTIPFKLFNYQKESLKHFQSNRFNCYKKCRQCGISTLTGAFALWFAMFFGNKTILIVSKRDLDAKSFLRRNIRFPYDNLPKWMKDLWPLQAGADSAHTLGFPNGSRIMSLTSSKDTLRSNASSLNIIDEAAFIPDMEDLWASGLPTLIHGGCLSGDTLISDRINGLEKLVNYGNLYKSSIYTDIGIEDVTGFHDNGNSNGYEIITEDGFNIKATNDHKFRILSDDGEYIWCRVEDLKIGSELILSDKPIESGHQQLKLDTDIFNFYDDGCQLCGNIIDYNKQKKVLKAGIISKYCVSCITTMRIVDTTILPDYMNEDLAELIGIIVGAGFYNYKGTFGISCDRKHRDFISYIHSLVDKLFSLKCRNEVSDKDFSVRFNSKALSLFFIKNDIVKEKSELAFIPDVILKSSNNIKTSFLRGLFEADGSIHRSYVSLSSSSIKLIRQVQIMMLSLGMRTKIHKIMRKNGFSEKPCYVLRLKTRRDVIKFRFRIGFLSEFKKTRLMLVKESNRSHNDRYTNYKSICEFYNKSKGLANHIRQGILGRKSKKSLSRRFVSEIIADYPQLKDSTLGFLASNNLFVDKIAELRSIEFDSFDLTIEPSHCYIANGFISHNSVIVISTPRGIGNWYWRTWTDAISNQNDFNPIEINWYDMDWQLEYVDPVSRELSIIAPTRGLRETVGDEKDIYGKYYSPWLEKQYRALQSKGEGHLFRQEYLAEFLGSGRTVIEVKTLNEIEEQIDSKYKTIRMVDYVNPFTNEREKLDFKDELRVWEPPYKGEDEGETPHIYSIGVDVSSGTSTDYQAINVINVNTKTQVAELKIKTLHRTFAKMIDFIGRWYNYAFTVIERTGIGDPICQELDVHLMYPNLYREKSGIKKRRVGKVGFNTGPANKPDLNYALINMLGEDGVKVRSLRTYKELLTYVYLDDNNKRTGAEPGSGNNDDLAISLALALHGMESAINSDVTALIPSKFDFGLNSQPVSTEQMIEDVSKFNFPGNSSLLFPITSGPGMETGAGPTNKEEIENFTKQMMSHPKEQDIVSKRKHSL